MIKVKDLIKKYNENYVFKKFNYEFKKGLYLVIGSSGKGKTTLLNILGGVDKKFQGKLFVKEPVLYFKDKNTLPNDLTVKEIFYLFEKASDKKVTIFFPFKNLMNKKIKKLSEGEKQLVVLNLVLNSEDKIIILDEPFTALSQENIKKVSSLLEEKAKNRLIIIASHIYECFEKYKLVDLNNIKKQKIKDFNSVYIKKQNKYKLNYSLIYFKKTLFRKLIFIFSFVATVTNFFYINNYTNNLMNEYLEDLDLNEGVLIERKNDINELNENIFYEVIKKLSTYIVNYNASYYNSELYNYAVSVDNYYIDNGFVLSSFDYIEKGLYDKEIVLGFDYRNFCSNNLIMNCDENYLKTFLLNKKINDFSYVIKEIFNNEETVVLSNKRFNKIYEENEYEEYYFDIEKNDINNIFSLINNDDILRCFDFIKIGENDDQIRYKVSIGENKSISNNIEYSSYIVCLDKGYNCNDYLNRLSSLVSIDNFQNNGEINLKLYQNSLDLNEIVISSSLSERLNKIKGETVNLYFNYNDTINEINLVIKDVIESKNYFIYQNSNWSYLFFKEMLDFNEEDLQIKKLLIFEEIKKDYIKSDNVYENVIREVKSMLLSTNKIILYINFSLSITSVIVLVLVETFYNKFKKEYFAYLKILGIKKVLI